MDQVELQALISALEQQRNTAQSQVAQLTAKLTVAQLQINELTLKLDASATPEAPAA